MTKRLLYCWLLSVILTLPALAQIQEPIKFKTEWKQNSDTEAEIVFNAIIDKGWHVYSTELGEGGPISATFNIDKIEGAETVGKLTPVGNEINEMDPIFGMKVRYFKDKATFIQKIKITDGNYNVKGYLEYGACNNENCLPPTSVDFNFNGTGVNVASGSNNNSETVANTENGLELSPLKLGNSEKTDYKATYYITANLKIYEVGEPSNVYWSNDETLVEEKELTISDKIDINESVAIDFNRYNQLVTDFSKDYALLLDSTLDVTLHIALTNEEEELNKTKTVTATIPMNKQSFSITKNTQTNPLEEVTIKTHNFNVLYLIFAIIILVFDAIFIKRLIGYLKENVLNKNKYQKEIEKILKTYDQIIVISKNPPDIENVKKIEVENFEELLDAQEELNNPIIFYENKTTHRSMFVIIGQEIAWIYHLIDEENKVLEVL